MGTARLTAVLLVLGVLVGCGNGDPTAATPSVRPEPTGTVTFPDERVTVRFDETAVVRAEVAVTVAQLSRGLMFREELGSDEGMLFLLPGLRSDGFYMKDTLIPLSIAYMRRTSNRRYQVVAILDMEPCPAATAVCPDYPPGALYDAALEVNKGWFEREGVTADDTATIEGPIPSPFDQP